MQRSICGGVAKSSSMTKGRGDLATRGSGKTKGRGGWQQEVAGDDR